MANNENHKTMRVRKGQTQRLKILAAKRNTTMVQLLDDMMAREERIRTMYDYTVIEDNGGGLHLFLFRPGCDNPCDGFTGFEYNPGSLVESLDALDNGDDATTWEGHMDDPQAQWDYIHSFEFGYQVICSAEDGKRTTKPDKMGRAGQIEFEVEAA
jgi:hypothetical protein